MWLTDRLANLITGLGTAKDKGTATRFAFGFLDPEQLTAAYRGSWLPRKVIDIPAADMTRAWRSWQAEEDQIELIEATEKRLKIQSKVKLAKQWARLYGGAAIYIGTNDLDLSQELRPERISKDGITYMHVMSRWELTAQDLILDPLSPYYGEPVCYTLAAGTRAGVAIHPSRVIRFIGRPVPRLGAGLERWGDSELQIIDDALKQAGVSLAQVATLFNEAKTDIISVPGLSEILATAEGTSRLSNRFAQAALLKSAHNVLLLQGGQDAEAEKWETRQIDFAGFPPILQLYLKVAAGAADIPVTRLLNDSPSGMQSTGDSDTTNYYDRLAAEQSTDLTPELERGDELIIRSSLGNRPPDIHYRWNPLWQMSDAQKADVALKRAQATQIYAVTAVVPDDVLGKAVRNQLVESGDYPGIEAAYAEYDAAVEAGDADPDPDDEPAEPPQMGGVAALLAAAGQGVAPPERKIAANDAAPRSLYVMRPVENAAEILAWARKQGFTSTLKAEDLHVTIVYSRQPVDWFKAWSAGAKVEIAAGGARTMEQFGEATVLLFASDELQWRHREFDDLGASWDHPEYQPHITISYGGAPADLSVIEPYQGRIVLGPERFAEVDEDWRAKIKEDA